MQQARAFVLRKKYYFIYILVGVCAGAILRPIVMYLAEFSMPEGWRHARAWGMQPFSVQHVVEPFIAAAQTLGRWTIQGVVGAVTWVYETVANLILMSPSAMVMAVIGAAIGFWLARRRHQAVRNTNRRRGASARVVPSVGLAEPPTPAPGVGLEPRARPVDEPRP